MYIPLPTSAPPRILPHDVIGPEQAWWTAWNFDPQYLIPVALMGFLYARGLLRWTERTREHSQWRTASYYGGLLLLVLLFESPLDRLGEHHFSLHMVQHSLVMMGVPPLIYLGAPATPILKGLPKGFRRSVVAPFLSSPVTTAVWDFLTKPLVAIALFTMSQWLWHLAPGWYEAALQDDVIHDLQHISFLAVAMIFWWNVIDPKPRRSRISSMGLRIVYFYGGMVPKHVLAAFISFADHVFYPTYETRQLFLPLSPIDDQRLAGVLMWVPFGEMLNIVVAGVIFYVWWKQSDERTRAEEAERLAREQAQPLPSAGG